MIRKLLILGTILTIATSARTEELQPISGVFHAEEVEGSPSLTASGMAWWKDRLIFADLVPMTLGTFTPPDPFGVYKTLTHPVGVAVDPKGNLIVTEKEKDVLFRVVRFKPAARRRRCPLPATCCS